MARSAPSLEVRWFDDRLVGKVVVSDATYFGYDQPWLAEGHSLSPLSVPFTPIVFRQWTDGFDLLPGFVADALPDQWGRLIMEREFRTLGVNPTPMRMLAWVGNRGLGALSYVPALEGMHSQSAWAKVTPRLLTQEAAAVVRKSPPDTYPHLRKGGTAGGAYPKVTVGVLRDGTMLTGGGLSTAPLPGMKLGILKLDTEDDPRRPSSDGRVEAAYLRMAQAAGISTTRWRVMSDPSPERERHHLWVERFDICPRGQRRHMLSLAGALHRHDLTYVDLLLTVRDLTSDRVQVLEAVRRMCFNVRSGNADDHGKNHGFLFDSTTGRWTLSPAYDLTPSHSRDCELRGLFPVTFGVAPLRIALMNVAAEAGITEEEFEKIDGKVAEAVTQWEGYAEQLAVPAALIAKAKQIQMELAGALTAEGPARRKGRRRRW